VSIGKSRGRDTVCLVVDQPNPIKVLWGILGVLRTVSPPNPVGAGRVDHEGLAPTLSALGNGGLASARVEAAGLRDYIAKMSEAEPDMLAPSEALAFWINLYNAGAVELAIEAWKSGAESVLRMPNGFNRSIVSVAGENLSLDAIEHAKIRRFKDPRIHAALVCGSLSCPTLRSTPYNGVDLDRQLDDQMRAFLANGGSIAGINGEVLLSRVFLWYGGDVARPQRMPVFIPTRGPTLLNAIRKWLPEELKSAEKLGFQEYDWSLACSIA